MNLMKTGIYKKIQDQTYRTRLLFYSNFFKTQKLMQVFLLFVSPLALVSPWKVSPTTRGPRVLLKPCINSIVLKGSLSLQQREFTILSCVCTDACIKKFRYIYEIFKKISLYKYSKIRI